MFYLRPCCLPSFAYLNHYIFLSIPLIRLLDTALRGLHYNIAKLKWRHFHISRSRAFRHCISLKAFVTSFSTSISQLSFPLNLASFLITKKKEMCLPLLILAKTSGENEAAAARRTTQKELVKLFECCGF